MSTDYDKERKHAYESRLALLGFYSTPPAWAHNMAHVEADMHVADLKRQEREDAVEKLKQFRETL